MYRPNGTHEKPVKYTPQTIEYEAKLFRNELMMGYRVGDPFWLQSSQTDKKYRTSVTNVTDSFVYVRFPKED